MADDSPVRAALVLDRPLGAPGDTATLGISFDIEPGWNLYWVNPGESGAPPKVTLTLPPGVNAGEIQWPRPERKVLPGDILDYIYTRRVTLVVPLKAGPSYDAALRAALEADLWWLMCDKDRCVPGETKATLALTSATPNAADRLREASANLPVAASPDFLKVSWDGSTLVIRCEAAEAMTFFPKPETDDNPTPPKVLTEGVARGDTIRLSFPASKLGPSTRIVGNLEVHGASKLEGYFDVAAPAPPMSSPAVR